jgi:hypothetical protein
MFAYQGSAIGPLLICPVPPDAWVFCPNAPEITPIALDHSAARSGWRQGADPRGVRHVFQEPIESEASASVLQEVSVSWRDDLRWRIG